MKLPTSLLATALFALTALFAQAQPTSFDSLTAALPATAGFLTYHHDAATDRILLQVPPTLGDLIYVESLASGVGSNDIGLDRGQLGDTRLVRFRRAGNKLLLTQPNLDYRASSSNAAERASVAEAFAESVLWGFPVLATSAADSTALIDLTPFLLQDAHDVAGTLEARGQGRFKVDPSRSALYLERTRSFPRNTEFEAVVTLTGQAEGRELRSVAPTPDAVATRQHHSFVALPEPGYAPRDFHVASGYFPFSFQDYATPIGTPLVQRYIRRHRLAPGDSLVYYVDRGAPEPISSALVEGASWWDQAFQAAGFPAGTFRVRVLPEGVDPLDVRYNVIQWVHRSTRGWSYGASVTDPRTGEILKGHVSLGSLRARQDYLIAQGLAGSFADDGTPDPRMLEFALARLRQLSAHEVGHTLGLAHNFAASADGRASVMDYPHPLVRLDEEGEVDLSFAYDTDIGSWDMQAIKYGYRVLPEDQEASGLRAILRESRELELRYLSDQDARPSGGASPDAHLWDNGADAADELARVIQLRQVALAKFNADRIAPGRPLAELEAAFVPVYLMHRYQVEAAVKAIGGVSYTYAVNEDDVDLPRDVSPDEQEAALRAVTRTLNPSFLSLSARLLAQFPPLPPGYARGRELFASRTSVTFDPWAAAEASAEHSVALLLDPARVSRLLQQGSRERNDLSKAYAKTLLDATRASSDDGDAYAGIVVARLFEHGMALATDTGNDALTRGFGASLAKEAYKSRSARKAPARLKSLLRDRYKQWRRTGHYEFTPAARMPDGSPI